jgi:hypothetical protein
VPFDANLVTVVRVALGLPAAFSLFATSLATNGAAAKVKKASTTAAIFSLFLPEQVITPPLK